MPKFETLHRAGAFRLMVWECLALGSVKGDGAPEVWKFMRDATGVGDPTWNFSCKFLVNREGEVSVPQGNMLHEIAALL